MPSISVLSLLIPFSLHLMSQASAEKIKVFILAGQSNMQGHGVVSMNHPQYYNGGKGNLVWSMANSKSKSKMKHLKDRDGNWSVRDDVTIVFKTEKGIRKGKLTIGFSGYGGNSHIGPELQFGHVIGDFFKEPVLIIKTAWGGKSLMEDFRPPSSSGKTGPFYTKMITEIRQALEPLKGKNYEISGFVWQQGWNDMCSASAIQEYSQNLQNLAKDIRLEFKLPNLPMVVGQLGNGGPTTKPGPMRDFREAQEKGTRLVKNATFVKTTSFARPKELSPNPGHSHHWYGNAESYFLLGDALAESMKSLLR